MNARARRPIGVFDSGVGGLTVLRALRRELPAERLLYLGDTARVPYGAKSQETVTRYSLEVGRFLEAKGVKHLVVACNTATALALPALVKSLGVGVTGVIEPAVRAALAAARGGDVGVIGTEATVASGAYQRAWRRAGGAGRMSAAACPLFVPLVEEGWWGHRVTREVARTYLARLGRTRPKASSSAAPTIPAQARPGRRGRAGHALIDSGAETAREVRARLGAAGLLRTSGAGGAEYFVTDGPERFERLARRFLGKPAKARVVRFPG
jgi:glutamate racemase